MRVWRFGKLGSMAVSSPCPTPVAGVAHLASDLPVSGLMAELDEIGELEAGWLDSGTPAPDAAALRGARRLAAEWDRLVDDGHLVTVHDRLCRVSDTTQLQITETLDAAWNRRQGD